ncbi:kinase-like domain-containing protein, partial [Amylostereum chailletii]
FTPLALLGSGTHGSVFLVSSPTSQRYALKVVNKAHAKKRRVSGAQLLREQAAMHKARDARGIVRMHASWHDKKHYFFLLEAYPNGDLYERVYAARLPSASVQFYAAQLLLALDHLHALHIVHHDLKLENIFLDAHGNVVLGDFGLCEFLDPVPHARCATHPSGRQSGTLPYFSPEIVKQMAVAYDVDRWAFGVVVYELLMSKLPFTDACEQDVVTRIIHAKPKFDASVHPEAKDFV